MRRRLASRPILLGLALGCLAAAPAAAGDPCVGGVTMTAPRLDLVHPQSAARRRLAVRGTLAFTDSPPALDLAVAGMEIEVRDLGNGGAALLDVALPGGAQCRRSDGWTTRGRRRTRVRYRNARNALPPGCARGSAAGVRDVRVTDRTARGRGVRFRLVGRKGAWPDAVGPFQVTIVLGAAAAAATGGCGAHAFAIPDCTRSRKRLRCASAGPATIGPAGGDGQSGPSGSALAAPFLVAARDAAGRPVAGQVLAFVVTAGGGSLSATSVATDADGMAATTLTLGAAAGPNTVEARAPGTGGGPVAFGATGTLVLANADARLGVNMERVGDPSRAWPFVDLFKLSRPWTAQQADGSAWSGAPLALTPEGWVASLVANQVAVTTLLSTQGTNYPTGDYVCLWDGQGTLDFRGDATLVSQTPGRAVVHVAPTDISKTVIAITATDPADPVRNVRFLMPGFEATHATQVFHPTFLASLAPFRVIRFLNWMRNGSPIQHWSERTTPASATQAGPLGVAPEHIVDLANRLGADVWLNIPHLADDDYVTRLATLVRDQLDPHLRVFVEHSNELWGGFAQGTWAQQQGVAAGLSVDPFVARIRWHSQRSVALFAIFEQVFGGTERLVRVLGASHTDPATVSEVMDWQDAWRHADAVATAPYFGGSLGNAVNAPATVALTVPEVLAALDAQSVLSAGYATQVAALVAARGLRYVAYEGGQALYGQNGWENDATLAALIAAANRDPGMRQVYVDHLNRWEAAGGGLFLAFVHAGRCTGAGCWGLLESQQQDPQTAPKWLGLLDW